MINLSCPQCQTVLPVREDKIGKSNFVCPQCYHPLEAPVGEVATNAPPASGRMTPAPAPVPAPQVNGHGSRQEAPTVGADQAVPALKLPPTSRPQAPTTVKNIGFRELMQDEATLAGDQVFPGLKLAPPNPPPAAVVKARPAARVARGTERPAAGKPAAAAAPRSGKRLLLVGGAAGAAFCVIALIVALVMRRGSTPTEPTTTSFLQNLQDPDPHVRATAVKTIADLGPRARPLLVALLEALKDPDPEVRGLAKETLTKRGPPDASDLPVLSLALEDPNADVRLFAVGQVSHLKVEEARDEMPVLRELVNDDNAQVSKAAAKALRRMEQQELASLSRRLESGSPTARAEAAQALGEMGPSAMPARASLMDAMTDKNSAVRKAAKGALARMGPEVVPILAEALKDPRVETRRAAAEVLGLMGSEARDVIPTLIAGADDPAMRKDVVVALEKIGSESVPTLVRALAGERDSVRQSAIGDALVQLGPDALPALNFVLKNPRPEIREVAARTRDRIVVVPGEESGEELTGRAGLIFTELRGQFNVFDANKDEFLDKAELAVAFRGPKAMPPEFKGVPTAKDLRNNPDAWFLAQLDRDGDDRISRAEFDRWARDYALAMSRAADASEDVDRTYLELNQKIAAMATEKSLELQQQLAATMAQGQVDAALANQQAVLDSALQREQALLRTQLLQQRAIQEAAVVVLRRRAGPVVDRVIAKNHGVPSKVMRPVRPGVTLHPPHPAPHRPTPAPHRPTPAPHRPTPAPKHNAPPAKGPHHR
jgi:HEAT repeat protein